MRVVRTRTGQPGNAAGTQHGIVVLFFLGAEALEEIIPVRRAGRGVREG